MGRLHKQIKIKY